ncbi:adenine deaminase [Salidesulfovibrio onnuriiensis]|uniref:adenine deaminase n=1 Tax=Salidesulfovibrio onnuriiensis TaxID=2583823 RepID=UPI0011CCD8B4|nr:adenine deaminase [Salidesulfovibrio onnuriiensis]
MIDRDTQKRIVDMAAGREPADLLITNAKILDVFSHEIVESSLAVGAGRIVGMGDYEARETLDAKGAYIVPGLIDSHVHIESSLVSPKEFARAVVPHGVTTIIADPHEIANVRGLDGIRYMLDATRDLPMSVYIQLPSCVPATGFENSGAVLRAEDLAQLIDEEYVGGIGEMMNYPGVVAADKDVLDKVYLGISRGKVVDGHSPAISGRELNAYAASGIKTDHECSTVEEMHERLRQGMYVLIREGSAAQDLEALVKGVTDRNFRRCIFCTDDRQPEDLLTKGSIDNNIRKAVRLGLDPVLAVVMASLNAANCYGLKGKGAIAPGWVADFLLVDDLADFNVRQVYVDGVKVAENGVTSIKLADADDSTVTDTVHIQPVTAKDLEIKLPCPRANVISMLPHSLVTKAEVRDVRPDDMGLFQSRNNPGLLKLAVVERHHAIGNVGVGLIENYGLENGAVATTVAHDSHNIVVCGDNDADMLAAIKDIEAMGGGITLVREGKVVCHLPLPIGGLMSDRSAEEVAAQLKSMVEIAYRDFAVNPENEAFMALSFMTLPVIPEIKLTDQGLFDVRKFDYISVCAE